MNSDPSHTNSGKQLALETILPKQPHDQEHHAPGKDKIIVCLGHDAWMFPIASFHILNTRTGIYDIYEYAIDEATIHRYNKHKPYKFLNICKKEGTLL